MSNSCAFKNILALSGQESGVQQNCSNCIFLHLLVSPVCGLFWVREGRLPLGYDHHRLSEARPFKPMGAGPKECRQLIACHLVCLIIVHLCSDATQATVVFKIGTVSLAHTVWSPVLSVRLLSFCCFLMYKLQVS